MEKNTYSPVPFEDSTTTIPETLDDLIEEIAKSVHDTWAFGRFSQGWTYGPQRNDQKKTHPCLIPYEELTEDEKLYDRNTAMTTIKMIINKGYSITKIEKE